MSWQTRLDKALLDVDAKPQARFRNLRKVFDESATVLQDVGRAVTAVAEKGFKEGHVEAIETLWPEGTLARRDLEGLQALRKQVPELVQDLQNLGTSRTSGTLDSGSQSRVSFGDITSGLLELATDPKKQRELVEEAKNSLRTKPRGLETPSYSVVRRLTAAGTGTVELRRYQEFTVARRAMPSGNGTGYSSGQGFTTLAGYLFGKNSEAVAMEMTSPVEISYDGGDEATMSFVLPKAYAGAPPIPDEDTIEVLRVPERLVAVKAFPGVVTEGEVRRQRAALSDILAGDGGELLQVNASQYSVLQYNPPYTLPWRRLNELAVVVVEDVAKEVEDMAKEVVVEVSTMAGDMAKEVEESMASSAASPEIVVKKDAAPRPAVAAQPVKEEAKPSSDVASEPSNKDAN